MNSEREPELRKKFARAKLVEQRARAEYALLQRARLEEQRARWEKNARLERVRWEERKRAVLRELAVAQLERARSEESARAEERAKRTRLERGRSEGREREVLGRAEGVRRERARSAAWRVRSEERERSEEKRARSEHVRSAHFLLAIAVRLLPPSERDRFLEEFRAELLDIPRNTRLSHALSLLRGVLVLRLRRGLTKATDDAVRRADG